MSTPLRIVIGFIGHITETSCREKSGYETAYGADLCSLLLTTAAALPASATTAALLAAAAAPMVSVMVLVAVVTGLANSSVVAVRSVLCTGREGGVVAARDAAGGSLVGGVGLLRHCLLLV